MPYASSQKATTLLTAQKHHTALLHYNPTELSILIINDANGNLQIVYGKVPKLGGKTRQS